ncbi:hypothetical protein F8M41_011801 [Gigaspora margarita]|uniref:Uncharacterized protein n=1 Tax=Gigaspora margarita TaxID=4874 RepID=A0A8H3WZS4_GIGMA|nr:hypothetical protein F8M41_011801 [Gigaspora margarita]
MLLCLICLLITKLVVNLDYEDNDSNELSTKSVSDMEESGPSNVMVLILPSTQSIDPQNYEKNEGNVVFVIRMTIMPELVQTKINKNK